MKKILILFLLFFILPARAIVANLSGTCGEYKYDNIYAKFTPNQHTCSAGEYMPAGYDGCQSCLFGHTCSGGTFSFNPTTDQGITINTYTCSSGYFLPANTLGCVACPTGFTCNGGTFEFNADEYQGLVKDSTYTSGNANNVCAVNYAHRIYAHFTPHSHDCSAGQYLPAGVDSCTQCPANSYCSGGTFTFNETTNQGIERCATGYSAPAGSDAASDCTVNTITINWDHADSADISANNAGACTYGGDIRTPRKAQHINGKIFTGWVFNYPTYDFSSLDATLNKTGRQYSSVSHNWEVYFPYGTIYGKSVCSVTSGRYGVTGTPDETQTSTINCWCKVTQYKPADSDTVYDNISPLPWVYGKDYTNVDYGDCSQYCEYHCSLIFGNYEAFREVSFGANQ